MRRVGTLCAFVVFAVSAAPASAATYTVTGTADGAGSCNGATCTTLRAAVAAANLNSGSTITLGPGRFALGPPAGGQLLISASTTIAGAGAASTTIAQTDGVDRVLGTGPLAAVTLSGLTITGGRLGAGASEPGAGIYALGPLTLRGVTLTDNRETTSSVLSPGSCCQAVGGIASLSSLTLIDSAVTGNSATGSAGAAGTGTAGGGATGGIYATQFQPVTITDSVVSDNTAIGGAGGTSGIFGAGGAGGGAYGGVFVIDGAPLTVSGSTFSDNRAQAGTGGAGHPGGPGGTSDGGAIFIPDGVLEISASTFEGNVADSGGGGAGLSGTGGGAGANAFGGAVAGGARLSPANWIVNTTFFGNRVAGGAGGTGSPAGAAGVSGGGGLGEDTDFGLTLVSSTFDANSAQGPGPSYGGNLYDQFSAITIAQTLFAGGVATNGANCAVAATETDDGHNLETTSPTQCGLSAAQHDLIGAGLQLPPPAANGGPAPTIGLPVTSAAVGAGGTCLNYAVAGDPPLQTDERGEPRSIPCDIGALELQRCSGRLLVACSSPSTVPTITGVTQSASRWRRSNRRAVLSRGRRPPVGTTFTFTLNEPATATLRFTTLLAGRSVHRRCVAQTSRNRHERHCTRRQLAGTARFTGHAGVNKVRFYGRLSGKAKLKPGRYTMTIVVSSAAGQSASSKALTFTIVR